MPANTAKGYPYPIEADPLANGNEAIQALASAVDTKSGVSASGGAQISFANVASASVTITFPVGRFTVAPAVTAMTNSFNYITGANAPTTSAVVIYAGHRAATLSTIVLSVWWIARQE